MAPKASYVPSVNLSSTTIKGKPTYNLMCSSKAQN